MALNTSRLLNIQHYSMALENFVLTALDMIHRSDDTIIVMTVIFIRGATNEKAVSEKDQCAYDERDARQLAEDRDR
jgi:hypothetical protein